MLGNCVNIGEMVAGFLAGAIGAKTWTMAIGGDVMLDRISHSRKPFSRIKTILEPASIAIVNLEVPLTSVNQPTKRKTAEDIRLKRQFVLKAEPAHAVAMRDVGIDMVSLANNHIMDHGEIGLKQQIELLRSARIQYAGAGPNLVEAERPAVFKVPGGPRVALISFLSFMGDTSNWKCTPATEESAGLAALIFGGSVDGPDRDAIQAHLARARLSGEFVAVAIHWGIEKTSVPTPYQVALGRAFINAGADLVIGHHPHVLQGAELYHGKPIFYSLGNLVSRMSFDSAIFTLSFKGSSFQAARMTPLAMADGVPTPKSKPAPSISAFRKLVMAIQARFRNPASAPLDHALKE